MKPGSRSQSAFACGPAAPRRVPPLLPGAQARGEHRRGAVVARPQPPAAVGRPTRVASRLARPCLQPSVTGTRGARAAPGDTPGERDGAAAGRPPPSTGFGGAAPRPGTHRHRSPRTNPRRAPRPGRGSESWTRPTFPSAPRV